MTTESKTHEQSKKEATLKSIKDSLTPEEAKRLDFQRQFAHFHRDKEEYHLALACDPLRMIRSEMSLEIEKKLWNIEEVNNQRARLSAELSSGKITSLLKDGVTMTENEVRTQIKHQEWVMHSEIVALRKTLLQLRTIVGQHDAENAVIMSLDEFNDLLIGLKKQVGALGLGLY